MQALAVVALPVRPFDADAPQDVRQALARELHDRVTQILTAMVIDLEEFKLAQADQPSVLSKLHELQQSTREVLANVREVLYELRGESGFEYGFQETVRKLLIRFQARTHITARLHVSRSWPPRLRSAAALQIYRIIEEALTNVRMHSGASLVEVALGPACGDEIKVAVRDDGRGIDLGDRRPGLGLVGMRERAMIIGGRLEVRSAAGGGTTVRAIVPKEHLT